MSSNSSKRRALLKSQKLNQTATTKVIAQSMEELKETTTNSNIAELMRAKQYMWNPSPPREAKVGGAKKTKKTHKKSKKSRK